MQSKMYEQGVTCTNCHNPHSGKLVAEGNSLCAQCHQPAAYDTPDHHHHEIESTGAQCVNCHMPERTYMQVDNRRDHSFTIPRPRASLDLGVPNACTGCHIGSQDQWAVDKLSGWGVSEEKPIHAYLGQRAQSGDILVTRPLTDALKDHSMAAITRASLLSYLGGIPSRLSIESARASLDDESPLVRVAAVSAMQALPPEPRWQFLSPYLDDPSATVRFAVSESLLGSYSEYFPEQQQKLKTAEEEYRKMLAVSEDSPATQLAIAELETSLRNLVAAERAYKRALQIEPGYVPAMLNLADYYRSLGREQDVGPLLVQALEVAPDSGAANHSYGLYLIRKQDNDRAIGYLEIAVEQIDAQPRFSYVYAIALESMGRINDAIGVLEDANQRWPNQYDLLLAQVMFMEKSGNTEDIYRYISALTAIAPGSPEVKSLVQRFGN
jgi:predicted CXXCH cytochrome family protein